MAFCKLSPSKIISSKIQNRNSVYSKCLLRIYSKCREISTRKGASNCRKGLSFSARVAYGEQKGSMVPGHSSVTREHGPGLAHLSIVKKIPKYTLILVRWGSVLCILRNRSHCLDQNTRALAKNTIPDKLGNKKGSTVPGI